MDKTNYFVSMSASIVFIGYLKLHNPLLTGAETSQEPFKVS